MAVTSFQNITIADYLRILFQRLWIIVLCVSIAVVIAAYFAFFSLHKRFEASMELRVFQKHSSNPYLRQLLPQESLNHIITDLKNRLQGEKRLKLLAKNLRLRIKNEYIRKNHQDDFSSSSIKNFSKVIKEMSDSERQKLISRLELVTLAKILGVIPDSNIFPFEMRNDLEQGGINEYLLDEENEKFIINMKKMLFATEKKSKGKLKVSYSGEKIRQKALLMLDEILSNPERLDELTSKQLWELQKEYLAVDRLIEAGFYNITIDEKMQNATVRKLKSGLDVGINPSNFVTLVFDSDHPSIKQAFPHLVVLTAYQMIKSEYYVSEEGHRVDAKKELRNQIKHFNDEIVAINKQLANHSDLIKIQMAYAKEPDTINIGMKLKAEDFQLPRISNHIKKLNKYSEERRKINIDIKEREARIKEIDATLKDPSKVRIVQKTIKTEDSPVTRRLESEKRAKEQELARLRIDATDKHPMVKKLIREINQLEMSIAGLDTPIETTIEKEHPMLSQWKAQREMHINEIAALKARLKEVEASMKIEMQKAIDAPQRLQKFEDLQRRRNSINQQLSITQQQLEKILSEETVGKGILRTEFEIYRSPIAPTMHYAPRIEVIIAIGVVIGLVTALSAIFFIEYTDHSVKGIEDIRRNFNIPVLGTIPEFEFQEYESAHIKKSLFFRNLFRILPVHNPNSRHDRIVAKKNTPWFIIIIVLITVLFLGGFLFVMYEKDNINSLIQKTKIYFSIYSNEDKTTESKIKSSAKQDTGDIPLNNDENNPEN